ncbi:MAG: hypothetical protein BGO21_05430 [Dyadobacter sp. 50-39]|uniref:metallophosphoesterase family protein n=1 Tax=Dyadobacter sp. 50-39 TaxID=1895756 RepID=UPI000959B590|nr:metallophosphoesterase [Dyadobacter sp. 50-39]OJV22597.1 MAG: hypothetical protein BGO21_05430 [Dyadobacter sp. 50-39]
MINKLTSTLSILALAGMALSCKGVFEFSPNQIVLEEAEKNLRSKNIEKIRAITPGDTLRFIVASDTHQWLDETADFVKSANQQANVSFVAHLGDVTATSTTQEYKWFNKAMASLKYPYVTALGEMDTPGDGAVYKQMFGEFNYSFALAGHKFVFLNTNSSVFPASVAVPDLGWLATQISGDNSATDVIVLGHTPPFDADFKTSAQQQFANTLSSSGKVRLSFFGHQHTFSQSEPYKDGVRYYVTAALSVRQYLVVSLWEKGYKVSPVTF